MGKKLSPHELEAFFSLDQTMNRDGLDGPELDEWFHLCSSISNNLSGPSDAHSSERTAFRVPIVCPVEIRIGETQFAGTTRNVSVQGVSIGSDQTLPVDNRTVHVTIKFSFPRFLRKAETIEMAFSGHVRWSKVGSSSIMNLEFTPLEQGEFEALENVLHRYIKTQIS
jgi:hypothetical protein